jgi:ATP-dependent DNA ligase
VELGFEGIMLRSPNGLYKHGRSPMREQGLMKVKRFHDAEAFVVGVVEKEINLNPATTNALGLTQRSSSKANKKAAGTLGALVCELRSGAKPVRFEVGTGFDEATRARIWAARSDWIGSRIKFKYQSLPADGRAEVPRFPWPQRRKRLANVRWLPLAPRRQLLGCRGAGFRRSPALACRLRRHAGGGRQGTAARVAEAGLAG